nr:hypothetical protein KXZ65_17375 [Pectobacterium sp. PL152]
MAGKWSRSGTHNVGYESGAAFCEMAWNQGDDIYGYANNRFLAGAEYVAKSNLTDGSGAYYSVPWKNYRNRHGLMEGLGTVSQGNNRPCWETIYNHYAKRKGIATPTFISMYRRSHRRMVAEGMVRATARYCTLAIWPSSIQH